MPVREIRLFGDPVLKTVSEPITEFDENCRALILDLIDTTKLPGRAGVAAAQIGVNLQAFSYNVNGKVGYLINPQIIELAGELTEIDEGCLSLPGLWHKTPRYEFARARGFNVEGEPVEIAGSGLLAQALQHECDHLAGMLYIDRLRPDERKLAMGELRKQAWFLNR